MKKCLFISFVLLCFSCGEKEEIENLSNNPYIRMVSVTPTEVKEFSDSIVVVFSFEDNNGDLGSEDPDENLLEIKDTRLEKADGYFIPPLSPKGTNARIQGELRVVVKNLFLLGNGGTEYTTLEIRMRDRAGNQSNTITSPLLEITK